MSAPKRKRVSTPRKKKENPTVALVEEIAKLSADPNVNTAANSLTELSVKPVHLNATPSLSRYQKIGKKHPVNKENSENIPAPIQTVEAPIELPSPEPLKDVPEPQKSPLETVSHKSAFNNIISEEALNPSSVFSKKIAKIIKDPAIENVPNTSAFNPIALRYSVQKPSSDAEEEDSDDVEESDSDSNEDVPNYAIEAEEVEDADEETIRKRDAKDYEKASIELKEKSDKLFAEEKIHESPYEVPPNSPREEELPKIGSKRKLDEEEPSVDDIIKLGILNCLSIVEYFDLGKGIVQKCDKSELWNASLERCKKKWSKQSIIKMSPESQLLAVTFLVSSTVVSENLRSRFDSTVKLPK